MVLHTHTHTHAWGRYLVEWFTGCGPASSTMIIYTEGRSRSLVIVQFTRRDHPSWIYTGIPKVKTIYAREIVVLLVRSGNK